MPPKEQTQLKGQQLASLLQLVKRLLTDTRQNDAVTFTPDPNNARRLLFLLTPEKMSIPDLPPTKYTGEYIMEILIQPNYPHEPPHFRLLTPNGLYKTEQAPCVVLGHFYGRTANAGGGSFPSVMGVKGFVEYVVAGFVGLEKLHGTHILSQKEEDIVKFAEESWEFNQKKHPDLMKLFDNEKEQTVKWLAKQKAKMEKKMQGDQNQDQNQEDEK